VNKDKSLNYVCNKDVSLVGCFLVFRKHYFDNGLPLTKSLILYLDLQTGRILRYQLIDKDISVLEFSRFVDYSIFRLYNLFVIPPYEFKVESTDQRIKLYIEERVGDKLTILFPAGISVNKDYLGLTTEKEKALFRFTTKSFKDYPAVVRDLKIQINTLDVESFNNFGIQNICENFQFFVSKKFNKLLNSK